MFRWNAQFVRCNLCSGNNAALLFAQDQHGFGLRTVLCRSCGLIYLNPRPSAASYDEFYRHWYHRLYPSRMAFHDGKLGGRIAAEVARRRAASYQAFFGEEVRLLELGPGEGAFLSALAASYPQGQVRGVDLAPAEAELCQSKGLDVVWGRIGQLPEEYLGNTHVAMFHVLEHTLNPLETLRHAARCLRPDGVLFVEVPNILGSWQGLGMIHIAHPYQFAPATLTALLRRAGFEVVQLETLEDPFLPSSLRVVARRSVASEAPPLPPPPDVEAMRALFAGKLAGWKKELRASRLKRWTARALGPHGSALLWEWTAGRAWRDLLSASERNLPHSGVHA